MEARIWDAMIGLKKAYTAGLGEGAVTGILTEAFAH